MIAIIKATILNVIRNRKNFMFLVFFPVFLTFLLGTVLSSYMDNKIEVGKIEVHYYDEGNENLKEAFAAFKDTDFSKENNLELNFTEEKSIEDGKNDVRVNKSIFVHLNEDKIDFYSNDSSLIQSSFVYGVLNNITKRYAAIGTMYKINASKTTQILESNASRNFLKEELVEKEASPRAIDYYGVAEIGLMIFYFVTCPIFYLKKDSINNVKERIISAGVSEKKYYLASFIGYCIFGFMVTTLSYIINLLVLKVNYGENLLLLPIASIPFIIMVVGIGTIVSMLFKDVESSSTIIQSVIIPSLTFLGGGYAAFGDNLPPVLNFVTSISPLRWFNMSIFRVIYTGDNSLLIVWTITGAITLGIIILLINLISNRRDKCYE